MNSADLPVTDFWDPEWEIYDVPFTPFDVGWRNPVTGEQCDLWWTAYCHLWDLRWIMDGSAEYRPDYRGRQLTTGHDQLCPARYGADEECAGALPGFCEDVVDPQPPRPVERFGRPPACMCRYDLHYVPDAPGPRFPIDPFGRFTRKWGVWSFRIHPKCPHHGDRR